jgi:tRNA(fMet)-specific endonuclease VapC
LIPSAVVDTDVVSFIFKQDTRGALYEPHLTGRIAVISFMTLAELDHWALRGKWGEARRNRLDKYLERFAVFHSDEDLCGRWAQIRYQAIRDGRPIETADAWIAATAVLHNIPLITHNGSHYAGVPGLRVITEKM